MTAQPAEERPAPVSTPLRLAELVDEMEGRIIDLAAVADKRRRLEPGAAH